MIELTVCWQLDELLQAIQTESYDANRFCRLLLFSPSFEIDIESPPAGVPSLS
jgi:hypothetical protein